VAGAKETLTIDRQHMIVSLRTPFRLKLNIKYKSDYKDYTSKACLVKRKSKTFCVLTSVEWIKVHSTTVNCSLSLAS